MIKRVPTLSALSPETSICTMLKVQQILATAASVSETQERSWPSPLSAGLPLSGRHPLLSSQKCGLQLAGPGCTRQRLLPTINAGQLASTHSRQQWGACRSQVARGAFSKAVSSSHHFHSVPCWVSALTNYVQSSYRPNSNRTWNLWLPEPGLGREGMRSGLQQVQAFCRVGEGDHML